MPKFRIEVLAPEKRDEKETDFYPIPDPEQWEAFYEQQRKAEFIHVNDFIKQKRVALDKAINLKKGAEPMALVVSEHLLGYLKSDKNISVRVMGPLEEQSPARAIAATTEAKVGKRRAVGKSPAPQITARKAKVA